MVTQPLPITGRRVTWSFSAASAAADARVEPAPTTRSAWHAPSCARCTLIARAAQPREAELTLAPDRLRELAGLLARPRIAGESAGYDRLRADASCLDPEDSRGRGGCRPLPGKAPLAAFFAGAVALRGHRRG